MPGNSDYTKICRNQSQGKIPLNELTIVYTALRTSTEELRCLVKK